MAQVNPLSELIAKWSDDDDPETAIFAQDLHAFNLMKKYRDGVPTVVVTTATEKGVDYVGQLLGGMIIDVMGTLKEWDDDERAKQMQLFRQAMRLVMGEAWIATLDQYMPPMPADGGNTEEK